LAQSMFDLLPPADQWLLYASAYTADKINQTQLDNWWTELEMHKEADGVTNDPFVTAARYLALSEIELHNYRFDNDPLEEKQDTYERAVAHKDAFNNTIRSFFDDHIGLPLGDERIQVSSNYIKRLRTSFVKAGLWRDIEGFSSTYYENAQAKMVGKALTGELDEQDLKSLALHGKSAEPMMHWINDIQNGINAEAPKIESFNLSHATLELLEATVPELIGQL